MKRTLFFCCLLIIAVTVASLVVVNAKTTTIMPKGPMTTVERSLSSFSAIKASNAFIVEYHVVPSASGYRATLTLQEDLIPYLVCEVSGSCLSIGIDSNKITFKGNLKKNNRPRAIVYGPADISSFNASSAADLCIIDAVNSSGSLSVSASSAADIDFRSTVACSSASIKASSAADIDISFLDASAAVGVSASSSADVEIKSISAKSLSIDASSAADVDVKAGTIGSALDLNASSAADIDISQLSTDDVKADASSAADITFKNSSARSARLSASSGADISAKGLKVSGEVHRSKSSGGSVSI